MEQLDLTRPRQSPERLCCPVCRLIQPRSDLCVSCGQARPASIRDEPEKFLKTDTYSRPLDRMGWERLVKILIIPSLLVIPAIILLRRHVPRYLLEHGLSPEGARFGAYMALYGGAAVILLLVGRVAYGMLRSTKELHMRSVVFSPHLLEVEGVAARGHARELDQTLPAHLSEDRCLVASLVFRQRLEDRYYLRSLRSVDFVLELDAGERVLVTGEVWLDALAPVTRRIHDDNKALVRVLGLECAHNIPASAKEYLLRPGDQVQISGALTRGVDERLGGECRILRGHPGQSLVIRPLLADIADAQNSRGER
jgi:hypothetical protein